ncbi:bifunctional DedA family/phosphatase PAP2 family protein [Cohnella caldifontis]|uniref:bifunctional DedA family/phosphatase PAP2 family protein n=1 Tax=Cohnella caldifontis TaxID=3027471 RepID=UPI0023EB6B21|nr:bifunctional DedA family/phosphatase PAP2 family protein [Cohnella sp. YIM B05605]
MNVFDFTGLFTHLLEQYGYWVLFLALMLELIALPLPGEFIMTYAGLIVYQGQLDWLLSILVAGIGSCIGMTISYGIGYRLGKPFFEKYGSRFHFGPEKLNSVSRWYGRYGNKLLLVAYFIPGVRHLTGLFSGITRLPYRKYVGFAFPGAFLWVSLFISLGRLLGPEWEKYHHTVNRYMLLTGLFTLLAYLTVYLYRKKRETLKTGLVRLLNLGVARYRSLGRVRLIVVSAFAVFVAFFSWLIGVVQDFLAQEFGSFDDITVYIVHQIFASGWTEPAIRISAFGTAVYFAPVIAATGLWIALRGQDRRLELLHLVFMAAGGWALNAALRYSFHRIGPAGAAYGPTFPSDHTMLALAIYGFAAYLLFRHYGNFFFRFAAVSAVVIVCLILGISRVYSNEEYPSDVTAGYAFGGVWLSLNVMLLEAFRMMRGFKKD